MPLNGPDRSISGHFQREFPCRKRLFGPESMLFQYLAAQSYVSHLCSGTVALPPLLLTPRPEPRRRRARNRGTGCDDERGGLPSIQLGARQRPPILSAHLQFRAAVLLERFTRRARGRPAHADEIQLELAATIQC